MPNMTKIANIAAQERRFRARLVRRAIETNNDDCLALTLYQYCAVQQPPLAFPRGLAELLGCTVEQVEQIALAPAAGVNYTESYHLEPLCAAIGVDPALLGPVLAHAHLTHGSLEDVRPYHQSEGYTIYHWIGTRNWCAARGWANHWLLERAARLGQPWERVDVLPEVDNTPLPVPPPLDEETQKLVDTLFGPEK